MVMIGSPVLEQRSAAPTTEGPAGRRPVRAAGHLVGRFV